MRPKPKSITIAQQSARMLFYFPHFIQRRENGIPTWRGTLKPSDGSPLYTVKVEYNIPHSPRVWVLEPEIDKRAPHRYADNSLCLYHPLDGNWSKDCYIAETILPWSALWLSFYDLWLVHGVWYGPEAPHNGTKMRD